MSKYETLGCTSGLYEVTYEQFATAIVKDKLRNYNNSKVNIHEDYLSVSAPKPPNYTGYHFTLILTKEGCYEPEYTPMAEIYATLLEQEVLPQVVSKVKERYKLAVKNFTDSIDKISDELY